MARPSGYIDGDRLWGRLMQLSRFGAEAGGVVNRQTLSAAEIEARAEIVAWGRALGLKPATDPAANLFLRLEGSRSDLPPVMAGSHIDSQPTGGKFDGAYGVMAALEAVNAFIDAGITPVRSIEVVAWTNEEASRFAPGMTGSGAFTGSLPLETSLSLRDGDGIELRDALATVLASDRDVAMLELARPVSVFIEPHIEQGPVLDREAIPIGVVTGIQGTRRYRVRVSGETAHSGTAERHERRDALMAAVRMVSAIDRVSSQPKDVKLTVGLFQVTPNAPSVVPSEVLFSIDLRHPANSVVDRIDAQIREIVEAERGPCHAALQQIQYYPTVEFPGEIRNVISASAASLGIPYRDIASAAGHDARSLHAFCPTGMIFVPCRDGISHNPAEWAEPADLTAGARVLADAIWQLAMQETGSQEQCRCLPECFNQ